MLQIYSMCIWTLKVRAINSHHLEITYDSVLQPETTVMHFHVKVVNKSGNEQNNGNDTRSPGVR